jgi:hypothetical protein
MKRTRSKTHRAYELVFGIIYVLVSCTKSFKMLHHISWGILTFSIPSQILTPRDKIKKPFCFLFRFDKALIMESMKVSHCPIYFHVGMNGVILMAMIV